MNPILQFLIVAIALAALAGLGAIALALRSRPRFEFSNIAEGERPTGNISKKSDAAFSSRFLVVKIGTDADHVNLAGTADVPIGVATDEATAAEDDVNVRLFGASPGTFRLQASAAIAVGDWVVSAASGQVRTLPVTAGTYYILGRALQAASAAGDLIEVAPVPVTQRVV